MGESRCRASGCASGRNAVILVFAVCLSPTAARVTFVTSHSQSSLSPPPPEPPWPYGEPAEPSATVIHTFQAWRAFPGLPRARAPVCGGGRHSSRRARVRRSSRAAPAVMLLCTRRRRATGRFHRERGQIGPTGTGGDDGANKYIGYLPVTHLPTYVPNLCLSYTTYSISQPGHERSLSPDTPNSVA